MNEVAQLITALATLIAAVGAVVIGVRNSRKIDAVHRSTNGLVEQLGAAREAKGLLQGQNEAKK